MYSIDINCDLGESFGRYVLGNDRDILGFVTSVNIACGYHAGDPVVMEETVKRAIDMGVSIGAHPSYPDLLGFGRRSMQISLKEARAYMIYQIGALKSFVESYGSRLQHVKPHGALYNDAAKNARLANALAQAVYDVDKDLIFMGLSGSCMIEEASKVGLRTANEVFADRAYNNDGFLVPRGVDGAVIHDSEICINRVKEMIINKKIKTIKNQVIDIKADSVCVHGDNHMALEFVQKLNSHMIDNGILLKSLNKET